MQSSSLYQNRENRYRSLYQNRENRYPSRWHVPVPKICIVPPPRGGGGGGSGYQIKTKMEIIVQAIEVYSENGVTYTFPFMF